uniref:Glycerol-3-phosphate dehydrogenase NAD-dependent C-terminal domain-containing protein n=1 Tax=Ditylenchus dipsaci TaxID=166011 RepID=A0A915ED88_9BILA
MVKTGKTIPELEKELLNGQSAQGPLTAEELYETLKEQNALDNYPLFVAVHRICKGELEPKELVDCLRNHPAHSEK